MNFDSSRWNTRIAPDGATFACPCGHVGPWAGIRSHRRGWKKRPQCAGKITAANDMAQAWYEWRRDQRGYTPWGEEDGDTAGGVGGVESFDNAADGGGSGGAHDGPPHGDAEDDGEEENDDPEAVARRLLAYRQLAAGGGGGFFDSGDGGGGDAGGSGWRPPPPRGGGFDFDLGAPIPPGEFTVEHGDGEPVVSQDRLQVTIPVAVLLYYDYARMHGWHKGDGSLSAFVIDCLATLLQDIYGLQLVMIQRDDFLPDQQDDPETAEETYAG